eukprot:257318-Prymnesium_polylepis.1
MATACCLPSPSSRPNRCAVPQLGCAPPSLYRSAVPSITSALPFSRDAPVQRGAACSLTLCRGLR